MEPPSPLVLRGCVPWQKLLLAVSLIAFWTLPSTAQLTVESVPANTTAQLTVESAPANAAEGEDVLLLVHNWPENTIGFSWFKGESVESAHQIVGYEIATQQTTTGPAHSGRETLYTNGSLLFQNVRKNDTGLYTLHVIKSSLQIETVIGQLRVCESVTQPSIQASNTIVLELDPVVMTCLTSDTAVSILWFFNGQSLRLTERTKLSQDSSTLTIEPIRREDAGGYQCSNSLCSRKSDPISLKVISGGNSTGLSGGAIAGIMIAVLVGVALAGALGYFLFFRRISGTCGQCDLRQHQPPVSAPGCNLYSNINLSDHQVGLNPAAPIYEDLLQPDTNIYCRVNRKGDMAS